MSTFRKQMNKSDLSKIVNAYTIYLVWLLLHKLLHQCCVVWRPSVYGIAEVCCFDSDLEVVCNVGFGFYHCHLYRAGKSCHM